MIECFIINGTRIVRYNIEEEMPQLEPNYFINSVSWGILMIGVIYIIVSKYLLPIYVRTILIRLTLMNGVRMGIPRCSKN